LSGLYGWILIFSKTAEEHKTHVRKVLELLQRHRLYANRKKCSFFQREVNFLGHVINADGITVDPAKTAAVKDWPRPSSVAQVRSFLGLSNYFRKFLMGYSNLVRHMTNLTRKSAKWEWTQDCEDAFQGVKTQLTSAPVLALPEVGEGAPPFTVVCDASDFGLGAVLMQNDRPVAFESRKLSGAEINYTVGEKELLGVVNALQKWRCYLEGVRFTVVTDHHPNTYLPSQPNLSRRQARWSELLSSYDFGWSYRPGRTNVADPMSRSPALLMHMTLAAALRARGSGTPGDSVDTSTADDCTGSLIECIKEGYSSDPWFALAGNTDKLVKRSTCGGARRRLPCPTLGVFVTTS